MTELQKEKRRQRRLERLGTNNPRCGCCGETDDRCLERHDDAGRKFDDGTVLLCRNCHRKVTDDQRDHPEPLGKDVSLIEAIGHLLLGMADLFILLAAQCRKFAEKIFAMLTQSVDEAEARQ